MSGTKYGAKSSAKPLPATRVPTGDLQVALSQNAGPQHGRVHSGRVETLMANDITARGIHVDDVTLAVNAATPTAHKAFLHRSAARPRHAPPAPS